MSALQERHPSIWSSPNWPEQLRSLSPQELNQYLDDARVIRRVGALIVTVSLPVVVGSGALGMAIPGPNADINRFLAIEATNGVVFFGSFMALAVGINAAIKGVKAGRAIIQEARNRGLNILGWLNKRIELPSAQS